MLASQKFTFEAWVKWVFDRPVTKPEWWWDDYESEWWDWMEKCPSQVVDFMTRLFEQPKQHLWEYSDEQLAQGLWFIASGACSDHMRALKAQSVPLEARCRCVRSFYNLFAELFAARCQPCLSHSTSNPLNGVCFMWWEFVWEPSLGYELALHKECLAVMREILMTIPNEACMESALHGLGHWRLDGPNEVTEIVDEIIGGFLRTHPDISPELRDYAECARRGSVL